MKTDFSRIFKEDARLRGRVKRKQFKWTITYVLGLLLTTVILEALAVIIGLGVPWVLLIPVVTVGASIAIIKPWRILKCEPSLWRITAITHDYSTVPSKGTSGFEKVHSKLKSTHKLLIVAAPINVPSGREIDITAPAHLYRVYREGDVILRHPAFPRCACLTNPAVTICIGCEEVQSAVEKTCHGCGLPLFGVYSLRQTGVKND